MAVGGVTPVVRRLSLTSGGTELWVVRTGVVLHALVGVDAVRQGGVDGTTKLGGSVETALSRRSLVLGVTLTSHEQQTDAMCW